jgi:hypothetical protein
MNFKAVYLPIYLFLIITPLSLMGQLSKGGNPIQIEKLKSATSISDLVVMPAIDNITMKMQNRQKDQNHLKPFTFAHSFKVSLNLTNSGVWYNTSKVNVWQLRIRSVGAYSLNLIFDRFKLPENAKLFIINEKSGEIKGAYTSENNSASNVFAVEPIAGDELLLQYEEPVNVQFIGELEIAKVAHDFVGIVASNHRPLGISGTCNINVNCDIADGLENIRDGVCRIIIKGTEICTGTLVNNTALDGTPYLLTAYHCISTDALAQTSVFLFNYESPYCGSIDGDVSHSLSGSSLKASLDSLDFALVRLNNSIPDNFRPYLVGWNRKNTAPSSSMSIHHPLGDIKKVSIDDNAAVTAKFNNSYLNNGFWRILSWEHGVTEEGSSGGPLFDQNKLLIGSLTGGSASCPPGLPNNDYFEKFALAWNYQTQTNKQLKAWLDPNGSGVEKLEGMVLNSAKTSCTAKTNFTNNDVHALVKITDGTTSKGYWAGSNSSGFTEFAEQFSFSKSCEISGISIGVAKVNIASTAPYINIKVYSGSDKPNGDPIYSEKFYIKNLYGDAMNYLSFSTPVKTSGNFFISYDISNLSSSDSLMVYIANRTSNLTNSFLLKKQQAWSTYNSQNLNGYGSAILMEINVCNVVDTASVVDPIPGITSALFYPNPLYGSKLLTIETEDEIDSTDDVEVFDLMGKIQNISVTQTATNQLKLSFYGKRSGIYFVRLKAGGKSVKGKIAYIP